MGLGEGKLDTQTGSGAVGAVQIDVAAERLYSVLEAEQAGAAGKVGTSDAVVSDLQAQRCRRRASRSTVTVTVEARECLAALVNASATM